MPIYDFLFSFTFACLVFFSGDEKDKVLFAFVAL
jgi:hypothetical protein